jgi:hypothetical protein
MRIARFTIIAALCCLVAGLCFLEAYSLLIRRRADYLLRVDYEFAQRGKPPTLDEIRKAFGSDLQQLGPCTQDGCGYEVDLSNRLFHALHVAPYTVLRLQFWEQKGVMQSNSVDFYAMPHGMVSLLVKYCRACDSPNVYPYENSPRFFTGYVEIDLTAPETARKKAFAMNTACLSRWGGCTSVAQLLPTVWQQAGQGRVICIIPNRDGVLDLSQMK